MPVRPLRVKAQNELGKTSSLPDDHNAFTCSGHGSQHIFLGLGPHPERLSELTGTLPGVLYIETQQFIDQMDTSWHQAIPLDFTRIRPEDLTPERVATSTLWIYTPGLRLFPSFWGPIQANLHLSRARTSSPKNQNLALLPSVHGGLIVPEIARALEHINIHPIILPDTFSSRQLIDILTKIRPKLFLSLNLAGLDAYGEHFYLLREARVPVVAWLVDNPFHLLSKFKAPFWKKIPLGVTDNWFIKPLKKLGAHPFHLPLATDPELFHPQTSQPEIEISPKVTFVGRSAFPQKKGFFAGQTVPPKDYDQARQSLLDGRIPDFAWWLAKLNLTTLWPDNAVRRAGLGAEETSLCWRTACLNEAARAAQLTIVGDQGWNTYLSAPFTLHPPIDYYGPLAAWYQKTCITLNMTSLLLPHGLTQRHFDVWAAGGFLITDSTPGLDIFPKELTKKISFASPSDIPALLHRFAGESTEKQHLRTAWRKEILSHHTYANRIEKILEITNKWS